MARVRRAKATRARVGVGVGVGVGGAKWVFPLSFGGG